MGLTRREFLRICGGGIAGISLSQMVIPEVVEALEKAAAGKPPVLWIQGASCSGCSVSLLNTVHPTIAEVLLKIIDLKFHPTIMAADGEMAIDALEKTASENKGKYVLVVEGAIPTGKGGRYCMVGEKKGKEFSMLEWTTDLGKDALAVLAFGSCATFGGIQAAKPNPTGAVGVKKLFDMKKIKTPVINVPGCPSHPDWMVGTIAHILLYGIPKLDYLNRPKVFFDKLLHDHCPYRSFYDDEVFCKEFPDKEGCRYSLGCKGPETCCDAWKRRWNGGVNWCVQNAVCIGCVEPNFWDEFTPLYESI
ncbi:quinone-reactive Ni/Fe-hydrogenase small chain [Candidatus Desulfofervidus auxilii]|uniref:Iron hydrogenase n=1 Tax=Desulfofervidus auxilii TaxID=1621989 RepID=A0A7C1ZNT4_DESA2|nr:hydrogenase small subunit [Candidatus Desulfofervidus auxilii]AMM39969.1 quinone-reactive Ni/Fe-hydrogenase small chain [Candidatus Desulfofervidus auxilii]CAD7769634.1 Periplasmic [NiFeSe] hydrogenase small subunit [Candidatus Methanoperedenaceae archaeon GB50]CAD7770638.1 Periplasmic [NiFeSe] hydrogenase small subunit [Candidatus Methanoperedenaceae archaeon GB37]HEC68309.1 iron hydrogenase [Candidatus Desulfofervidus auxilii]